MSTPKTELVGNPWGGLTPATEKPVRAQKPTRTSVEGWVGSQPKKKPSDPARPRACQPGSGRVDVSELSIDHDAIYDPSWKPPRQPGKYDALFDALPIGKAITCKPQDCNTIANAMRNWARLAGRTLDVKIDRNYRGTGQDKVFLIGEKTGAPVAK